MIEKTGLSEEAYNELLEARKINERYRPSEYIKRNPTPTDKLEYITELLCIYCDNNFEPETISFDPNEGNPSWKDCEVACAYISDIRKEFK